MQAWRISKEKYAHSAFSGEGASRFAGRWNPRGIPVVYASEHLSLAMVEILVHADWSVVPRDLIKIPVIVPDGLATTVWTGEDLPANWQAYPAPEELQQRGRIWAEALESAVLIVPSAVIPEEHNLVINPNHPDFPKLEIGEATPFSIDPRLGSER